MRVYVEHPDTGAAGRIVATDDPGDCLAITVRTNPLTPGWCLPADAAAPRILAWSGTLGDSLFEPHPRTWMATGHAALDALCDRLAPELVERGLTLCFQPHARHVLSDPPSADRFLRERGDGPFEIALAPAHLFEPGMLDAAADHLERAFEILGSRCSMVLLADGAVSADGSSVEPVPPGRGCLPMEVLGRLVDDHVPATTPLVLLAADLPDQVERLAALGLSERSGSC